jgi:hypothetical protein
MRYLLPAMKRRGFIRHAEKMIIGMGKSPVTAILMMETMGPQIYKNTSTYNYSYQAKNLLV